MPFLIRVGMNPLLFLFVFTYIMPHMSGGAAMNPTAQMAGANFSTVLLPGLMAVAIMFSGIAAVALPLAQEFGITREIDDRVMCPLPVAAVAIEKIVLLGGAERDRGGGGVPACVLRAVYAGVCACEQLAVFDPDSCAGEPYLGGAGAGDRDQREAATDWADLRYGGDADYVSGLRLLPVGNAGEHSLAAEGRADQPDCLHERRAEGCGYAGAAAYESVADRADAELLLRGVDDHRDQGLSAAGDRLSCYEFEVHGEIVHLPGGLDAVLADEGG